jgi:hypothetical protein
MRDKIVIEIESGPLNKHPKIIIDLTKDEETNSNYSRNNTDSSNSDSFYSSYDTESYHTYSSSEPTSKSKLIRNPLALNKSKLKIASIYEDKNCPYKKRHNKKLCKYTQKYIKSNISAFYLDSKNIRTTTEMLKLGDRVSNITIVEGNPKIYEIITNKLKNADNILILNEYLETYVEKCIEFDFNVIYLDSMSAYFKEDGGLNSCIDILFSRLAQKKLILAFTTPLRNPYGYDYDILQELIMDETFKLFAKYQFKHKQLYFKRYKGQNSFCENMMFCLFYLRKK